MNSPVWSKIIELIPEGKGPKSIDRTLGNRFKELFCGAAINNPYGRARAAAINDPYGRARAAAAVASITGKAEKFVALLDTFRNPSKYMQDNSNH